ncbi:NADH:ubiquinone oxidoreductase subunit L [Buchnera aphidicola (Schlechtendalia chinensis)]|uniref:NADH:ubiquinone oxidoreductase subunit L n=1 Tax=Buchnera aphidicola subsp. Schlechtendalia chinensis TaxID=118110 RepID=A0A172WDB3_BUCSC|nr:NADH-quinone oxidoreductase subunit L [Buchnera aphidicola]ANF16960.1 NADH:ubiquinone oxidoreductase subunit L [Buchnera aphidicola (Schlechtendalia chinensis)]
MNIVYMIILFPLISCILLMFLKTKYSNNQVMAVSISSVFLSMLFSIYLMVIFFYSNNNILIENLWTFIVVNDFRINFGILMDGLSLTMLVMVTCIGFLVHVFSMWYMRLKNDLSNFFAYMNFFIASMVVLVVSDNLVFMFLGWEAVGLCSYLLVGFYYKNSNSNYAALKGFIITRIGDIFLLLSIFFIYREFGTTNFKELEFILRTFATNEHLESLKWITFFLLVGAVGKSAQIPLQTWLADAMVGPTPVSALIHAATMVTAGIYLIARTHFLFILSPEILYIVGIIGSLTLILSSCSALVQTDIKKILAYSTMSQIGYMFIALSMQNWIAAIKHLVVHAIVKALLFLTSGSMIILLNNEKNIFKMRGLKNQFPLLYYAFLIGGASLSSFPIFTSGFYSKGEILFYSFENSYNFFFISGLLGFILTTIYTFRMIFVVFHGTKKNKRLITPIDLSHSFPLIILMIFSTFIESYVIFPLSCVFPRTIGSVHSSIFLEIICSFISLFGIVISYYLWVVDRKIVDKILYTRIGNKIHTFWLHAWEFDYIYNIIFVKPYLYVSKALVSDPINISISFFRGLFCFFYRRLEFIYNGYLYMYLFLIISGCVMLLTTVILNINS